MFLQRFRRTALTLSGAALVAACSSGTGDSAAGGSPGGSGGTGGDPSTAGAPTVLVTAPATKSDSARFLGQASFGPNAAEIDRVTAAGYTAWLDEQFARQPAQTHTAFYDERQAANNNQNSADYVYHSFWKNALAGDDQLGQRVAFALSQVFVVSLADGNVGQYPRGVASYLDMLRRNAFGNFRTLLQDVTLHPMMGLYLSHMKNQGQGTRVPDENYAREVMQLFTVGLYELNEDGTVKTGVDGAKLESYTNDDVTGLAKVFTGWSWNGPDTTDEYFRGTTTVRNREIVPMEAYESYHAKGQKNFLKASCPAGTQAAQSLQCGLDILFNHPNVGPFVGRLLIQRLTTSNPSPAYVRRVAAVFANNGNGVRGDMKSVIRAILLDPEARNAPAATDARAGKVREPILRMSAMFRAVNATSVTGRFQIGNTDDVGNSLGQTAMRSPSVFNFYRPGYVPPNSDLSAASLVAPELQTTNETSIAGYLNTMQNAVQNGYGSAPGNQTDVKSAYGDEIALAHNADALLDRIDLVLMAGQMNPSTRQRIRDVVNSITISAVNATAAATARRNRVQVAMFLAVASPEFIAPK